MGKPFNEALASGFIFIGAFNKIDDTCCRRFAKQMRHTCAYHAGKINAAGNGGISHANRARNAFTRKSNGI